MRSVRPGQRELPPSAPGRRISAERRRREGVAASLRPERHIVLLFVSGGPNVLIQVETPGFGAGRRSHSHMPRSDQRLAFSSHDVQINYDHHLSDPAPINHTDY